MQSTMFNTTIVNKIQFHGIKTVYPFGERVQCFFTIPEVCQPQCGDWIGIFPVGWNSLVRDCLVRQMIRTEEFTGPYGQIEFEPIHSSQFQQFPMHQTYQFVYVTNSGEYMVLGSSTPFRFFQQTGESTPFFGGKFVQPEPTTTWFSEPIYQRPMFVVESEMEKLQNEIVGLEQGWKWTNPTPITTGTMWQPRLVKIEQILKEKVKIEQAQRRLDQFCMLAQLKSCERHIVSVQKREPEIKEFLLRAKLQTKIACFEQKIQNIIKTRGLDFQTPVEHYVRKYEQLLREKVVLDVERRRGAFHKLRQTIRDCERKLRELQTIDQEHLINFHKMLKSKLVQFESRIGFEMNLNQHFETLMGSFVFEQEKLGMNLYQAQRELGYLINEIVAKLQEMEICESGCYASLRIPKIVTGLMFQTHPKLVQIIQLEKKIAEQKMKLRMKMLNNGVWNNFSGLTGTFGGVTGPCTGAFGNWFGTQCGPVQMPKYAVEQITRGVWFSPIIEKLKQIQLHLTKPWTGMYQTSPISHSRFWFDKKASQIAQLIQTFNQWQTELTTVTPITQTRFRNILVQLQELRERECIEIPRFIHETIVPTTFGGVLPISHPFYTVVESCQFLNTILGEKINEINQWFQCQPTGVQQQMPFEWMFATLGAPHSNTMLELIDIEKKLVEMKGLTLASIHYMHLEERLVELEQFVRTVELVSGKRERCLERIRGLKTMLDEHVEFQPSFVTIPEQFFQHQTKFEKMCQLVGELECHLIEQVVMPFPVSPVSPVNFGGEFLPTIGGARYTLNFIHMKFLKLVQEFQVQFPECFAPKIEEIVSFLRTAVIMKPTGTTGQVFFGNELREKLAEFETILCQPECEISCLTTSIFPQSTMTTTKTQRECLKFLIRQVRELKSHLLVFLGGNWTESITTPSVEQTLVDLMNKRMWIEGSGRIPHSTTRVIETTGPSTIVKSVTVPVGNLLKPVSIERLVSETEEGWINVKQQQQPIIPRGVKFASYEIVDDECEQEDDEEWDEEEDFETGVTVSSILNKPQFVKIETNGNEECICQIEKHIRKCLGGEEKWIETGVVCPLCNVVETTGITTRRF